MSKLFLYADRRCKLVDKPSKATWKEIRYECQNQQAIIYDGDKIYHLKDNEMISFKGQRIYFRCRFPLWKMNGWKGKAVIGRGKECDIQIDSVHVSSRHCTLFSSKQGIVVEDLGSTNGTYVHGRRITETILQPGDGVLVANVEIVVFPDFLISYGLKKHEQIPEQTENRVLKKMKIHRVHQPLEFPEKIVEIELPRFDDREANTGLFQSLASSLMILMSGIATGLVLFFSGTSKEMMVPMLISNGMMGGSFLGFGLYNYRKNKQQNTKRIRWNETQYLSYLQEKEAEIWRYREESVRRFQALKEICWVQSEKTYGITHPLLIGEDKKPWITIRHAKIGYEHTTHPLALKVKALDQIQTETLLQPVFWWPGSQVYVQSGDSQFGLQLFLQFIWQAPSYDCKWIWIDRSLDLDRRLFLFPQCRLGQEKLWIRKKEDMTKLKDWIRHCKNVYVVSKEDWIDEYPEVDFSLCRISEKNGSETGKVVNHPVPVCDDIDQKLRQVLYTVRKEKENPLIQSFGMADGKEVAIKPSESVELCIPVGLDKEDARIVLDLHENKHGPHGLIAGMTGSGKSEWLSAFLMQLVLRNSSRLLQYILIDFKGGAFGSHFYEFPHCAGMVTNMEDNQIERFFLSLDAEIQTRQKRMDAVLSHQKDALYHIDTYNRCTEDKMSHLFLIVDEFAQLKAKHPEYMEHLKEISRIGRSLGIHLILATQKPLGVIDEQIWSNSTFRICLKVNSVEDSKEVLKNDQAFYLDEVGSFVMQVTNETQRVGKGFYLQEKISETEGYWIERNERNEVIHVSDSNAQSVLSYFSSVIKSSKEQRRWIVLPDLSLFTDWKEEALRIDCPEFQRQDAFGLSKGQSCFIHYERDQDMERFASSLIAMYQKEPLYFFGNTFFATYMDETTNQFDPVRQVQGSLFVALDNEQNIPWILPFLKEKSVRCIVFCKSNKRPFLELAKRCDFQMSLYDKDRDEIRILFNQHAIPGIPPSHPSGLIRWKQKIRSFYYPDRKPCVLKRSRVPLNRIRGIYLGKDLQKMQSVYWNRKNPLLVCFAQQSKKEMIEHWISDLEGLQAKRSLDEKGELYIVNLLQDPDFFQHPKYSYYQYDLDVLWIGGGLRDYAYVLKKNPPMEQRGNAVFYTENEIRSFTFYGDDHH